MLKEAQCLIFYAHWFRCWKASVPPDTSFHKIKQLYITFSEVRNFFFCVALHYQPQFYVGICCSLRNYPMFKRETYIYNCVVYLIQCSSMVLNEKFLVSYRFFTKKTSNSSTCSLIFFPKSIDLNKNVTVIPLVSPSVDVT